MEPADTTRGPHNNNNNNSTRSTTTWMSNVLNFTGNSLTAIRSSIVNQHKNATSHVEVPANVPHGQNGGGGGSSVTGAFDDFPSEEYIHFEPSVAWSILDFLNHYYIPLIIVVGFVGNTLSCVVFLSTHLHLRSSSYYLAALAAADLGFLASLMLVWLSNMGVEVFNKEGWCQIVIYLSSVFSFLSVWLIVSFTVERFIAVQYPLHRPHMCTIKRAKITISALATFAFVSHSYLLCVAGIVYTEDDGGDYHDDGDSGSSDGSTLPPLTGHYYCGLLASFYDPMQVINAIDTVATLILPLLLIIVMNTLIARQLFVFSRKHRAAPYQSDYSLQGTTGTTGRSSREKASRLNLSRAPSASRSSGTNSHSTTSNNNNIKLQMNEIGGSRVWRRLVFNVRKVFDVPRTVPSTTQTQPRTPGDRSILSLRTQYSITKMLLLISSVFVLLNLPSYVFRIYTFLLDSDDGETRTKNLFLMQQFSMLLYYTNFSINFLLYSTYGVTFRRALLHLTRKKLRIAVIRRPRSNSLQFK